VYLFINEQKPEVCYTRNDHPCSCRWPTKKPEINQALKKYHATVVC